VGREYCLLPDAGWPAPSIWPDVIYGRHTNEIPRADPLVQVDYVRVVDLDIAASKSDNLRDRRPAKRPTIAPST
jgi:hypothetical protein